MVELLMFTDLMHDLAELLHVEIAQLRRATGGYVPQPPRVDSQFRKARADVFPISELNPGRFSNRGNVKARELRSSLHSN